MSSLWSTSGGMNSEADSDGSGDDGNSNDVGTGGGKLVYGDDQCDSGDGDGDGGVGAATYSAMCASMDGDIGAQV
ncbi:hypothetical protein Tco_1253399 [Tanacetum coccineum]